MRRVLVASSSSSANESFSVSWLASVRDSSSLSSSSEITAGSGSYKQEDKGMILTNKSKKDNKDERFEFITRLFILF